MCINTINDADFTINKAQIRIKKDKKNAFYLHYLNSQKISYSPE